MEEARKDIFGNDPQIGDTVVWNPARYKGLVFGTVVDMRKRTGMPIVELDKSLHGKYVGQTASTVPNQYVPKTGFVIVKKK